MAFTSVLHPDNNNNSNSSSSKKYTGMAVTYDGLYTLRCTPSNNLTEQETTTELFESDGVGNPLTRPEIDEPDAAPAYLVKMDLDSQAMHLIDPLSDSILSTTTTLSTNKLRLITLHNPTLRIEMKNKSLISYEWAWRWGEDWRLIWNRNRDSLSTRDSGFTLSMTRKPDPNIDICCYRPNKKGNLVQILDYNLNRLEVDDRKGLEVAILSTLFSILNGEKLDTFTRPETTGEAGAALTPGQGLPSSNSPSPRPGNRRALSDEVETISPNEILISTHLSEEAYIVHCLNLMSDPNLIYLTLVANTAETVPRAISIASEIKRRVIKTSPREDENLMQYIDYPGRTRRESNKDKTPPGKIKIYLSRIQLEEFTPRPNPSTEKDKSAATAAASNQHRPGSGSGHVFSSSSKTPPLNNKSPIPQHARLQRPNGAPPLPPKGQSTSNNNSAEQGGRFRAFLAKVKSDA